MKCKLIKEKSKFGSTTTLTTLTDAFQTSKRTTFFLTSPTQTTPSTTVVAVRLVVVVVVVEDKTAFYNCSEKLFGDVTNVIICINVTFFYIIVGTFQHKFKTHGFYLSGKIIFDEL